MANLRHQTLNRLNGAAGCCAPIPEYSMSISVFEETMYAAAQENGFTGSKEEFLNAYVDALNGATPTVEQAPTFADFPATGREGIIYIDEQRGEAYYWDNGYKKLAGGETTNLDGGEI